MLLLLAALGCAKPTIVPQAERLYGVETRPAQTFVYLDYRWNLGPFDDAVALEQDLARLAEQEGTLIEAVARFPTLRDWQLGVIVSAPPAQTELDGHPLHTEELPAGRYARLHTADRVEKLFRHWHRLERLVRADGEAVDGPVIEVYPDVLTGLPRDAMRGEVRYHLVDPAGSSPR